MPCRVGFSEESLKAAGFNISHPTVVLRYTLTGRYMINCIHDDATSTATVELLSGHCNSLPSIDVFGRREVASFVGFNNVELFLKQTRPKTTNSNFSISILVMDI